MNKSNVKATTKPTKELRLLLAGCVFILSCRHAYPSQPITAIWANSGEDKVTRDELRATKGTKVANSVWDGTRISIFGGRNEVVAFNVILEAGGGGASAVSVGVSSLNGQAGSTIGSVPVTGDKVFDWTKRNIEAFYIRYLQVNGLSLLSYPQYDERLIPKRLERPWSGNGVGKGGWTDRPDHNKYYPDIAVPLELVPTFNIPAGSNQSIWVDVYIPKSAAPGNYLGTLTVNAGGSVVASIPIQLHVFNFTLPDTPNAKTMLYFDSGNINHRYLGATYINPNSGTSTTAALIRDRHYMLAHRHRLSLIGDSPGECNDPGDQPCPESVPRLDGSLFSSANGYAGPGENVSNNVFSIGTYGSWSWQSGTQSDMNSHTDAWATWFGQHAPGVEYFLYLLDESTKYSQMETWAQWILSNPGPGHQMKSMATISLPTAAAQTPSIDIATSGDSIGISSVWQPLVDQYTTDSRKRFFMYNCARPGSGSTAIEDDGVALRERAWGQFKKHVQRWFFWQTTYYNNYQGGSGETNVFETAQTFGGAGKSDPVFGQTGWNYSNGDGVLFYPGTDTVYPNDSYHVNGPFASLRLKYWRRGIQDVDYLTMAGQVDQTAVTNIVTKIVPKALWEYGVDSANDPTYVHTDISWSIDPDVWEAARLQLAQMLDGSAPGLNAGALPAPTLDISGSLPLTADITAGYPSGYNITAFQWSFVPSVQAAAFATRAAARVIAGANYATAGQTVSLPTQHLSPGQYVISVAAIDSNNNISPSASARVTLVGLPAADFSNLRVYPNPWRSDAGYPKLVTFDHLPASATVKIFSVSGHLVKTLSGSADTATWDLTNDSGDAVASGLFIYFIKAADGQTNRGKLAIIH